MTRSFYINPAARPNTNKPTETCTTPAPLGAAEDAAGDAVVETKVEGGVADEGEEEADGAVMIAVGEVPVAVGLLLVGS